MSGKINRSNKTYQEYRQHYDSISHFKSHSKKQSEKVSHLWTAHTITFIYTKSKYAIHNANTGPRFTKYKVLPNKNKFYLPHLELHNVSLPKLM